MAAEPRWAEPEPAKRFHAWRAAGLLALYLLMQTVGLHTSDWLADTSDLAVFASVMRWDSLVFLLVTFAVVASVQRFGRIGPVEWGAASLVFLVLDGVVSFDLAATGAPFSAYLPTVGAVVGAGLAVGWRSRTG